MDLLIPLIADDGDPVEIEHPFISDFPSKHDIGAWMIAWGIIARDFPIEDSV